MRLAYLGTPDMAVPPLRGLVDVGHQVVLVVSGRDTRRGRGAATSPSPVKAVALDLGLPVTDDPEDLLDVEADLGVVVAYGRIIKPHLLDRLPMVNLHFSLLPRWRGAAPVERAILAGDDRTGVCVMDVEETLDTGGVHARAEVPIGEDTTAAELRGELVRVGTDLLVATLAAPLGEAEPQESEGVTYAEKLTSEDRRLDWRRRAVELHRVVRIGGAWTTFRGRRLKVLASACGDGAPAEGAPADGSGPDAGRPPGSIEEGADGPVVACGDGTRLQLLTVQPEGKAAMDASDLLRGHRPGPDERLGQ